MSDSAHDEESLSAELGALRSALRDVRAPDDEAALVRAARAAVSRTARCQPVFATARARIARAPAPLGLAAAAALTVAVVAALAWLRVERAERVSPSSRAADSATAPPAVAAPPDVAHAFRPISFPRRVSAAESYSVVRVRLELASGVPRAGAPGAAIEADLLVGEDGLARAIRFDSADTLPVYAAFMPANGERR